MTEKFTENQFTPKRKSGTLIAGTVLTVMVAAIAIQATRATESKAGQEPGTAGTARMSNKALAHVNGKPITEEVVARECVQRYGAEVLENLINRTLIQQACSKKGVKVTEGEVLTEITRISKRFGLDTATWYKMLQAERGLTPLQYQRDVIWPMLALKKLAGAEVRITNDMMKKAYADAYGHKAKVKMIMLDNQRHARKVWEMVRRNPEDFARLAQEHSVEPNSKALGGAVPPIRRYTGAHENVRQAAFAMRTPGEISPIVHVGLNSYVIMKFEGFTERIDHDPKDVQAKLHDELMEQEVQRLVAETFQTLRDTADIRNHITGQSTTSTNPVNRANQANGVRQTGYSRGAAQPQGAAQPRR